MTTPAEGMAQMAEIEGLRAKCEALLESLEDLVTQSCYVPGRAELYHMHMATYEGAMDTLLSVAPDRWERTPQGIRRRT